MLYKVIDPNFILSDTYREWPFETKATYTVVCALANNKTGEFFHSIETIAHHANACKRAVQRSLRRMEDAGVITKEERAGETTRYKYNFPANIKKSDRDDSAVRGDSPVRDDSTVMGGVTEQSSQGRLTSHPIEQNDDTQTLITSTFTETIPFPNKQILNEQYFNEQDITTAYGKELISELIKEYGKEKVIKTAVAVLSLEKAENKGAYLRASLKGGYIPTNKKQREKEETKAQRLEYEKTSKQMDEWKRHIESVKHEADDPMVQARVQAEIEKMNRIFTLEDDSETRH